MLEERRIPFAYRDVVRDPLDESELRSLVEALGRPMRDLLRTKDKAYAALGLTGSEPDEELLRHVAAHPSLLNRPIGRLAGRAVLGRPIEALVALVEDAG